MDGPHRRRRWATLVLHLYLWTKCKALRLSLQQCAGAEKRDLRRWKGRKGKKGRKIFNDTRRKQKKRKTKTLG